MIDGIYAFQVDTLLGTKRGKVALNTEGDVLKADIDAPVIGKQQTTGTVDGNTFALKGKHKVKLLGKIDYAITGEVKGDDLDLCIDYGSGKLEMQAKRV